MQRDLPRWPVLVLGLAYPPLWLLGIGFLILPLAGLAAGFELLRRRHMVLPPGWMLWFGFLGMMIASVVQIDTGGRLLGFGLRASMVVGATILALYVYSATPRSVPVSTVYMSLALLWTFVVIGGWLGILFPFGQLATPAGALLPTSLTSNDLVASLVTPEFAQVENPWGRDQILRPAAPFQAANGWGCNAALLLPMILAYITMLKGWRKYALVAVSIAGMVPAMEALNRGFILGLGLAAAYLVVHGLWFGQAKRSVAALALAGVGAAAFLASGAAGKILERIEDGGSNTTREALYREAFERTLDSPLLGYGAPRPSYTVEISVGTQGHLWNIMFSHGFIALAFYMGFLGLMAWRGRRASGPALGAHVTSVVGVMLTIFYGMDGTQMAVLLVAGAVAVRDVRYRPWSHVFDSRPGPELLVGAPHLTGAESGVRG